LLVNGSRIALKSAEKADALRGVSLNGVILDEVASYRGFDNLWSKALRPALSDKEGFAVFISSPAGRNHFYDLYQKCDSLDEWQEFQYTTIEGGYVSEAEIAVAKNELDVKSYRQEYEATFESFEGLVVLGFERSTHLVHDFELLPDEPIILGCDLNVNIMSTTAMVMRGETLITFSEFYGDADTVELIKSIKARFPDRHITMCPDTSAGQRSTTGVSRTNLKMMREAFDIVKYRSKHSLIVDRVNAFNSMILSSTGVIRLKVTPNCKNAIESLEKHSYDPATGKPDKRQKWDDIFDGWSYAVYWYAKLTKSTGKVGAFRQGSFR